MNQGPLISYFRASNHTELLTQLSMPQPCVHKWAKIADEDHVMWLKALEEVTMWLIGDHFVFKYFFLSFSHKLRIKFILLYFLSWCISTIAIILISFWLQPWLVKAHRRFCWKKEYCQPREQRITLCNPPAMYFHQRASLRVSFTLNPQ